MARRVYIETSIVSYLTARPSQNLRAAAWQEITTTWWEARRTQFDLYISELVMEEAQRGDGQAAARRIEALKDIPRLIMTDSVVELSHQLLEKGPLPNQALEDALHISLSAVHHIDYLLTWNFRHLDNAEMKPQIREICMSNGYMYPEICTPQELMGDFNYEG